MMHKRIYKYPLPKHINIISASEHFIPRHVGMQNGLLYLWAEVDDGGDDYRYVIEVVGTGWDIDDDSKYIGTAFDGEYVWHVLWNVERE